MQGTVLKSTGSWYEVLAVDGLRYNCRARGKLRLAGIKETNPIAVGDRVEFELKDNAITTILPRENHILRRSVKKTGHANVLAANIDQVMVVATVTFPRTSLGFIDRLLVTAESFRIPQVIIFNKQDLLSAEGRGYVNELIDLYTSLGVGCIHTSAIHNEQSEILNLLKGKVTLIAGHSGVGKSTLLNKIAPTITQKVGSISDFSEKGTHTTTFAEMFEIGEKTFIIDTPGIKELGLVDMAPEDLSDYFPEMRELQMECKFGGRCLHIQEPKCAVIAAVTNGTIALSRYESYVSMVMGEDNRR